jgi:hypothetical protein
MIFKAMGSGYSTAGINQERFPHPTIPSGRRVRVTPHLKVEQDIQAARRIEDRWVGYYVTGATAAVRHLGNAMATDEEHPLSMVTPTTLRVGSLETRFDTSHYLSRYSDVGALTVFDHQMYMMSLISRVGWEVRVALYDTAENTSIPLESFERKRRGVRRLPAVPRRGPTAKADPIRDGPAGFCLRQSLYSTGPV